MPRLQFTADIDAPLEKVWDFYNSIEALLTITPPSTKMKILDPPGEMRQGVRCTLMVKQPPVPFFLSWETIITEHDPPHRFVDQQGKRGPFAFWQHEHGFEPLDGGKRTRLHDTVTYTPPLGPLGWIADRLFIRRQLTAMFVHRYAVTRQMLE